MIKCFCIKTVDSEECFRTELIQNRNQEVCNLFELTPPFGE